MPLEIQLTSLIFSFIFGFFFSLFLNLNHKIIYNNKKIIKIIGTIIVVMISTLTYFIILEKIDNAYFHPYQLIMIILGFYLEIPIQTLFKNKFKTFP